VAASDQGCGLGELHFRCSQALPGRPFRHLYTRSRDFVGPRVAGFAGKPRESGDRTFQRQLRRERSKRLGNLTSGRRKEAGTLGGGARTPQNHVPQSLPEEQTEVRSQLLEYLRPFVGNRLDARCCWQRPEPPFGSGVVHQLWFLAVKQIHAGAAGRSLPKRKACKQSSSICANLRKNRKHPPSSWSALNLLALLVASCARSLGGAPTPAPKRRGRAGDERSWHCIVTPHQSTT